MTAGRWVADELNDILGDLPKTRGIVVDAVLIPEQVIAIRALTRTYVVHVHLSAPLNVLAARYSTRSGSIVEASDYTQVRASGTEANIDSLQATADIVIDTSVTPFGDEFAMVRTRLDDPQG